MKQQKKALAAGVLAAVTITTGLSTMRAATFTETTDAGQTLPGAASTASTAAPAGTALTTVSGTFSTAQDADVFAFSITSPTSFSASTVNSASGAQDTALFLFDVNGVAIATNDDAPGGLSLDSALPAGNALYANLAAGTYYLGISESGNEAVNSVNQLLFAGYTNGDSTSIRGIATGLNPTTLAGFNSQTSDTSTFGAYQIDLGGAATAINPAAVPEPSTWAILAAGTVGLFAFLRRRAGLVS